jgi:PEP-CTERM motif
MLRFIYIATVFIGVGLFGYTPARADVVYSLDTAPAAWGAGPFGWITVAQNGSNSVTVTEILASGVTFGDQAMGTALAFTLDEPVTLSKIPNSFTSHAQGGGETYVITTNQLGKDTLSFTLKSEDALSASDFIATSGNDDFVSTVYDTIGSGRSAGVVSASAVPEPTTMAVLGMGLLGMSVVRKRAC